MARSPWPEAASSAGHPAAYLTLFVAVTVAVTVAATCLMPGPFACAPPGAPDRLVERELLELRDRSPRASRREDCARPAAFRARDQPPRAPLAANVAVEGDGDQPDELCVGLRRDERSGD